MTILLAIVISQFDQLDSGNPFDQIGGSRVADFDQLGPAPIKPTATVSRRRKLQMFSPSWCSGCQQLERAMVGKTDYDVEWVHDEKQFPSWVMELISNGATYPVAYWQVNPTTWRRAYGFTSYDDLRSEIEACDKNPTRNTTPAPPRHVSRGGLYYGTYRSVYDWPGDLRQHLTHSPHGYDYGYVQGLSDQQCISLHDQWHISHTSGGGQRRQGFFSRMLGRG